MKCKTLFLLATVWFLFFPAHANWNGPYFGINGGPFWDKTEYNFQKKAGGGFPYLFAPYLTGGGFEKTGNGGFFGGQLGFNRQFCNFVVGLEGSYNRCWQRTTATNAFVFSTTPQPQTTYQSRARWIASFTPRLGYACACFLVYFKGGLCLSNVKSQLKTFDSTANPQSHSFVQTQDQAGWILGGGIEYLWRCNWVLGLECDFFKQHKRHYGGIVSPDTSWPLEYTLDKKTCSVSFRLSYKI